MSEQREGVCHCLSYNAQVGSVPEVVLPRPTFLPEEERPHGVPVDACIANTVSALWGEGVETWGSCCGHNGLFGPPSLVLADDIDCDQVRGKLARLGGRRWRLLHWTPSGLDKFHP